MSVPLNTPPPGRACPTCGVWLDGDGSGVCPACFIGLVMRERADSVEPASGGAKPGGEVGGRSGPRVPPGVEPGPRPPPRRSL